MLSSENWKNKVNKRMQLIRALHPEFQKTIFIKGTEVIHPEFGGVKGFKKYLGKTPTYISASMSPNHKSKLVTSLLSTPLTFFTKLKEMPIRFSIPFPKAKEGSTICHYLDATAYNHSETITNLEKQGFELITNGEESYYSSNSLPKKPNQQIVRIYLVSGLKQLIKDVALHKRIFITESKK